MVARADGVHALSREKPLAGAFIVLETICTHTHKVVKSRASSETRISYKCKAAMGSLAVVVCSWGFRVSP